MLGKYESWCEASYYITYDKVTHPVQCIICISGQFLFYNNGGVVLTGAHCIIRLGGGAAIEFRGRHGVWRTDLNYKQLENYTQKYSKQLLKINCNNLLLIKK